MKRWMAGLLCAILVTGLLPADVFAADIVDRIVLRAVEDTYIQGYSGAEQNFGDSTSMVVRASNYRVALIKFDISNLPDAFGNVRLRLFKTSGNADVLYCARADSDWQEGTVTYSSRPAWENQPLDTANVTKNGGWFYFDVTRALQEAEDNLLSFAVYDPEGEENNIGISSREGGVYCPSLIMDASYVPVIAGVTVTPSFYNQQSISIPISGMMQAQAEAAVCDQYGQPIDTAVTWSVSGADITGVQIDNAGMLTISPQAAEGDITVMAQADGKSGSMTYHLSKQMDMGKTFPSLLYSSEDLPVIRDRITREPFLSAYAQSDLRKDRYDLERLDHADKINSWRTQSFSFSPSAGADRVSLRLQLSGKGELRLDNLTVSAVPLENNSFETGDFSGWTNNSQGGTVTIQTQSNTSYKAADNCGQRFACLAADDLGQTAEISCEFPVQGGKSYSGSIVLGQDQIHEDGFYIYADSYNGDQLLDSNMVLTFNRPTITRRNSLPTEHYANVYMNTGNPYYAEKAKKALLYILWEMQWGMDYYMTTGQSLDDTYEAVHIGRAVKIACKVYDQIRDVSAENGGFTADEENLLRARLYWIADTLMDTRYYDYTKEQRRKHNYNADRSIGLLVFAITFPEYEKSAAYYEHAKGELLWILDNSVGEDGGWPESTRYHVSVLSSLAFAAKVMRRNGDIDLFAHPKVKKMFSFLMHIQMPLDSVAIDDSAGDADYPPIGDADYEDFYDCVYAGIEGYAQTDPLFAQQLQYTLEREGGLIDDWTYWGPEDLEPVSPALQSELFADMGYAVFRQDYGTAAEDYAFFSAAGTLINSHQHEDRGSFILYADGTPISLDAGMCDYGSSEANWYEGPEAHNTVAFFDNDGKIVDGSTNAQITDFYTSEGYDLVSANIDEKENGGYTRHFLFLKGGMDAYVVWDNIRRDANSQFGVHALATGVEGVGSNELTAACYGGKVLDVSFLQPVEVTSAVSQTPLNNKEKWPQDEQQYITARAEAGGNYLVVLHPRDVQAAKLEKTIAAQSGDALMYRIFNSESQWYVAINMGETAAALTAPAQLIDTRTLAVYQKGETIEIGANQMLVLTPHIGNQGLLVGELLLSNGTEKIQSEGQLAEAERAAATVAVRNETGESQPVQLALAIYDTAGKLLEVSYDVQPVGAQKTVVLALQEVALPDESYRCKLYVWCHLQPVRNVLDWKVER